MASSSVARHLATLRAFGRFLAGNVAGSLGRWLAFAALVLKRDSPVNTAAVTRVLQQFALDPGGEWIIEALNEGAQASIYTVRARDGRPVWRSHEKLVVKFADNAAVVEQALRNFAFDDRTDHSQTLRRPSLISTD